MENINQWLNFVKEFRREHNWEHDLNPILFVSTVNGYHHFRYQPPVRERMTMLREVNNQCDVNAVLVHNRGVTAGRVPQGLSTVIATRIQRGELRRTLVFYTGQMVHDGPVVGEGPKLVCLYLLEFLPSVDLPGVGGEIRPFVNEDFMFM